MLKKRGLVKKPSKMVENLGLAVEESTATTDKGILDRVLVSSIQLDPDQPRKLKLTPQHIMQHLDGGVDLTLSDDTQLAEEFEGIVGLANSIKSNGLISPIEVHEDTPGVHTLVAGERRVLAHIYLREPRIKSVVVPKPKILTTRVKQLVENVQRVGLTLRETINGLLAIKEELEKAGSKITEEYLVSTVGYGQRQAQRYLKVLLGPEDVLIGIDENVITNLQDADRIANIPDVAERMKAIEFLITSKNGSPVPAQPSVDDSSKSVAKIKPTSKGKGRPATAVSLGKTENTMAVQHILMKCHNKRDYNRLYGDVDWEDKTSVKKAWQVFWQEIEKSL